MNWNESSAWQRSSRCDTGACVEVLKLEEGTRVRDAKDVTGPVLSFSKGDWAVFLNEVKAGRLSS